MKSREGDTLGGDPEGGTLIPGEPDAGKASTSGSEERVGKRTEDPRRTPNGPGGESAPSPDRQRALPLSYGESVMVLPGNPPRDAARLVRKGHDLSRWGQSRRSSRGAGRPRTGRKVAVQGTARNGSGWRRVLLPLMASRRSYCAAWEVSARTALEGKPDAVKAARPVWEGALRNRSG